MGKNIIPLSNYDNKQFNKKSNHLIFYFNKMIIKYWLLQNKEKRERYKIRKQSIRINKRIENYPKDLICKKKKIAVYTVLFGNYDCIKTIKAKNPYCDYYIFTDQPVSEESGWKHIKYNFPKTIDDDVLKNRFLKMHPHLLFPNYEYSIYLDATIQIELDIYRLMARMGEKIIGLFDYHQKADCTYKESMTIIKSKKAPKLLVENQMDTYKKEGFPKHFGFCECSLIIRKHNDGVCVKCMEIWWEEFINKTKRDQLSFMYSIWRCGLTKKDIAFLGATYWDDPIIPSFNHLNKEE